MSNETNLKDALSKVLAGGVFHFEHVRNGEVIDQWDEGNIVVNGKTLEEYLPLETLRMVVKSPLEITNTADQFDVIINVQGGGYTGQSGAMRHGITRALMEASEDYRPVLKAAGFVTRDPRAKERKKYGLKAARRAPQFSKR